MNSDQGNTTRQNPGPIAPKASKTGIGLATGIGIGAGIGVALGVLMKNIGMGIAVGVALGAGVGAALEETEKRRTKPKD